MIVSIKRGFIYILCTILLVCNISFFYFKPMKANATEVIVGGYLVEECLYLLLSTIVATLGVVLIDEAQPIVDDLYNEAVQKIKTEYIATVTDDDPQIKIGGMRIWVNTLEELEELDKIYCNWGGDGGKKPDKDPKKQVEEIKKQLGVDDTLFINGQLLTYLWQVTEQYFTEADADAFKQYCLDYDLFSLPDSSASIRQIDYSTQQSNNISSDSFDSVACRYGIWDTETISSTFNPLYTPISMLDHPVELHLGYTESYYYDLAFTLKLPDDRSSKYTDSTRTYYNNTYQFATSVCSDIDPDFLSGEKLPPPRICFYVFTDKNGNICFRRAYNNYTVKTDSSTGLKAVFCEQKFGSDVSITNSRGKTVVCNSLDNFVSASVPIFPTWQLAKAYLLGDNTTLASCSNYTPANIFINSDTETVKETFVSTLSDTSVDVETFAQISTDANTAVDPEISTQPATLPESFHEKVTTSIKTNTQTKTQPSTSTATKIDPLPKTEPDKSKTPQPSPSITPPIDPPDIGTDFQPLADFGNKLQLFFPFCIPWDIYKLVSLFKSDPVAPVFELPFKFDTFNINYVLVIDISKFDKYFDFFRAFQCVIFLSSLMYSTKKFI